MAEQIHGTHPRPHKDPSLLEKIAIAKELGKQVDGHAPGLVGKRAQEEGHTVAKKYEKLSMLAKELGSSLAAPFMTLSFLSLLVIPALKLGDQGLFDVEACDFMPLFKSKEKEPVVQC
jgi:adenine deaminase